VVKLAKIEKLVVKNIQDVIDNLKNVENGWPKKQNIQFVNSKNVANIIKIVLMENVKPKKENVKKEKDVKKLLFHSKINVELKWQELNLQNVQLKDVVDTWKDVLEQFVKPKKLNVDLQENVKKLK